MARTNELAEALEESMVVRDAAEVAALLRTELPRIERLLVRILGPRGDLEDLSQTAVLEVLRALPRFRGDCSMRSFVGAITVHVAHRAMRPRAFWRRWAPLPVDAESSGSSPEDDATRRQGMRCVRRALERIAPKKRIAFCLWALEGMDVREIAEMTGASVPATRSRIFYAQKELRLLALEDPMLREVLGQEDP